jgi:hypothetical protein
MRKKQNGGPMLFVKNGGNLSAPSDRPGGPLISYYAKKGGKIPQANFTNYSGTQMYGTGGNFDYNLPSMKYSQTPSGQAYKNGGTIHINPANKGKFNATKARTGKSTEELTHSSNPVTKKRAVFAQNAAKWKHENGGPLLVGNQHVAMGGSLKMYDEGGALNVAYGNGGMIKRADGSYSQRGLWDNIRANAGSGKEPTKEMLQQERKITSKYKNGGMINPYAMNIVGKGLKKYLLGGPADETDGVISGNQTPFSLWSRNQNMPAQTQQEGVFNTASNQQRKNFVTPEFAPGTEGKGMSIPETPEPQDTFKNEKQAAALYSGSIQAGSSFIGNFAETNRRKSEGAHDTGFGSDVKGAAKGMGTGASIGSTFGPIGTFAGAVVGGVAGYFSGKAEGKVKKRAYDAWQADYMKAEQSRIDSNSSRYQDFQSTGSGYYRNGGKVYKPSSVSTTMPQFNNLATTEYNDPNMSPINTDPLLRIAKDTYLDQTPNGKAYNIGSTVNDWYENKTLGNSANLVLEGIKLGTGPAWDAVGNTAQELISQYQNPRPVYGMPGNASQGPKVIRQQKALVRNTPNQSGISSTYATKPLMQKGIGGSLPYYKTMPEDFSGKSGNEVSAKDFWTDRGMKVPTMAMGGSMASNYMANQKAVGGNLVPLSSDAVEVKGPSHANGGVKLPEMEAEVEGKEVIKDDYVFSEQLGFAKEAKKLAKAKGRIEEKPSTPERINSLKLLESKENQLKLAQEFIRKQNNLQ